MAIEVCSEISSPGISPRISFSRDLDQIDEEDHDDHNQLQHHRLDSSLLDSPSDFNFCIGNNFFQEISSADELFSNGKILPVQMKEQIVSTKQTHQQPHNSPPIPSSAPADKKIIRLKEFLSMSLDSEDDHDQKPTTKSFWQFKRSSSLNCDSTRGKSLIKSLHFLSRSNSTGSAPNQKPEAISKESQKQNLQRQPSVSRKPSVSSSAGTYYFYSSNHSTQKPPLKKCGSYNGNGVRINPVLNIAPPCISNATVSGLFGFGSIFCNGKIRKKKR